MKKAKEKAPSEVEEENQTTEISFFRASKKKKLLLSVFFFFCLSLEKGVVSFSFLFFFAPNDDFERPFLS